MSSKIEVEWIAQAQGMNATLERINQKLDAQEKKLEQIGKTSKKAADAAAGSFSALQQELKDAEAALKGMAAGTAEFEKQRREVERLKNAVGEAKGKMDAVGNTGLASKVSAIGTSFLAAKNMVVGFAGALNDAREASEQVIISASEATRTIDTLSRAMQTQLNISDEQRQQQEVLTLEAARKAGVMPGVAFETQTQLGSSGFSNDVLDTMLGLQQATNALDDPKGLVEALSMTLTSYGKDLNKENTKQLGVALNSLFDVSTLQIPDVKDFAKAGTVFKNADIEMTDALAAFTTLRQQLPASEAATGLRNFVLTSQTAAGQRSKTDALAMAGLTPQQVDFVGEDLFKVIDTYNKALEKLPQEQRNVVLGKMFGMENTASASALLANRDEIARLQGVQGDGATFEQDVRVKRESREADVNRLEVERIQSQMNNASRIHEMELEIKRRENYIADQNLQAAMSSDIAGGVASYITGPAARLFGMAPGVQTEGAYSVAAFMSLEHLMRQTADLMQQNNTELKGMREDAKKNMVGNQRANQPPQVRPQAAPLPATTVP